MGEKEKRVLNDSFIPFLLEVGDEKNIKYKTANESQLGKY